MRRDDAVPEPQGFGVQHFDQTLDVRFVDTAQHIVEDKDGAGGRIQSGQREKDTEPQRVQMRVTEIGLRRRTRLATECRADFERGSFLGVQFEADLVHAFPRMDGFIQSPDLLGDVGQHLVRKLAAFLLQRFPTQAPAAAAAGPGLSARAPFPDRWPRWSSAWRGTAAYRGGRLGSVAGGRKLASRSEPGAKVGQASGASRGGEGHVLTPRMRCAHRLEFLRPTARRLPGGLEVAVLLGSELDPLRPFHALPIATRKAVAAAVQRARIVPRLSRHFRTADIAAAADAARKMPGRPRVRRPIRPRLPQLDPGTLPMPARHPRCVGELRPDPVQEPSNGREFRKVLVRACAVHSTPAVLPGFRWCRAPLPVPPRQAGLVPAFLRFPRTDRWRPGSLGPWRPPGRGSSSGS